MDARASRLDEAGLRDRPASGLTPGAEWHFAWRREDGSEMEIRGTYEEVVPRERIVNTESWGEPWPTARITTTFTEEGGRTTMTTLCRYVSREARDAAYATGMADRHQHHVRPSRRVRARAQRG
jgi:uncharacterized protein YndB with AHSA1/START domain